MDQIKSREAILLRKNEAINLELEEIKNSTSGIQEELQVLDLQVHFTSGLSDTSDE